MSTPVKVAEITAHKRLQGVEFLIKSAPLETLFQTLAQGRTVPVGGRAVATPLPPRRGMPRTMAELQAMERGESLPEATSAVAYTGATHKYQLELIENGIPKQFMGFANGRFDLWGSPELVHSRGPKLNLSLLTAVGIANPEGVSVTIPTVCSDKLLTEYAEGLKSAIRQLYVDYIGNRTHTIIITSEHVLS
jgi:hypothetical protein